MTDEETFIVRRGITAEGETMVGLPKDALVCRQWRFAIESFHVSPFNNEVPVRLRSYAVMRRDTPRHKWRTKPGELWDSMEERRYHSGIARADVPEPESVIHEVINRIRVFYQPLDKQEKPRG